MLGFYSISEQAAGGGSGGGSSGASGSGAGGGRFGSTSGRASGKGASKGRHKHHRKIDFSPLPPEYWQVREAYLKRKKDEEEGDLPQN